MIQGRIIRIFDDQTVAINVGSNQGVKPETRFGIYTPYEQIVDPETQLVLGKTRRRKAIVEPATIDRDFTLAVAPSRIVRRGDTLSAIQSLQGTTERVQDHLPVAASEIQPFETGSQIRVGDHVEEIVRAAQQAKSTPARRQGS